MEYICKRLQIVKMEYICKRLQILKMESICKRKQISNLFVKDYRYLRWNSKQTLHNLQIFKMES